MRRGSTGNAATCSPHAADPGTPTRNTAGRRTRSRPGTCSPAATTAAALGLTVTGPGGKLDVSWEPDGAIPPDGRFYPNPDPSAAYPLLELERAGIIRPVEPAITAYGPYGRPTRLMEVTEPYHNPMLRALRMR